MHSGLVLKNIGKQFAKIWILRNVNATVPIGKITAFIGPNGTGKTTLIHLIAGSLFPDEGKIMLNGSQISGFPCYAIARKGIGRQFQDVKIFGRLNVFENVMIGLIPNKMRDSWKIWFSSQNSRQDHKIQVDTVIQWIEHVGLQDYINHKASELSFGQQKLLSLARLFACNFQFLLLDEPTAGVSPTMVEKITSLIREAALERNITVALVEHNMNVVADLAYWIYFLNNGRIAFSGKSSHILENKDVQKIYIGL